MITQEAAQKYTEQLHPAFAGYLFDGEITEKDCLATILQMIKEGVLEPEFKENSILKGIEAVRLMQKTPQYEFEKEICLRLFADNSRLTAEEIGDAIVVGRIKKVILANLEVIRDFPIINNKLRFTIGKQVVVKFNVNGQEVDTIETANYFKNVLQMIILPIFAGIGALLIIIGLFLSGGNIPENYTSGQPGLNVQITTGGNPGNGLVQAGIYCLLSPLLLMLIFRFSKKTVTYDFIKQVVPLARDRYRDLYDFLKTYPLRDHTFTNPYLPFVVAFGLDNTWQKDFGLESEIKVDETPVTKSL